MSTKVAYERVYASYHPDAEEALERHSAYSAKYIRRWLAEIDKTRPVLDVGCGWGFFLEAFKREGFLQPYGVDISSGQVEQCLALGNKAETVEDTAAWLNARPGMYAAITCLDVLEHVPVERQPEFLAALHTALAPEGTLLLRVPNADSPVAARMRYNDVTHVTSYTSGSLSNLVQQHGFAVQEVADEPSYVRPPLKLDPRKKDTRHYLFYRYIGAFFRFWRKLEISAYCGLETGFSVPVTPNFVLVVRSTNPFTNLADTKGGTVLA